MAILENWPVAYGYLAIPRSLAVNARRFPETVALHDVKDSITYGELNSTVNRLAHGLRELGIGKGSHVAVLFGNTIAHLAVRATNPVSFPPREELMGAFPLDGERLDRVRVCEPSSNFILCRRV